MTRVSDRLGRAASVRFPATAHPLVAVRAVLDDRLGTRDRPWPRPEAAWERWARTPAIPYLRVLRAIVLRMLYGWHRGGQVTEFVRHDPLFRWFIGLTDADRAWREAEPLTYRRSELGEAVDYIEHAPEALRELRDAWIALERAGLVRIAPFAPLNRLVDRFAAGGESTLGDLAGLGERALADVLRQVRAEDLAALARTPGARALVPRLLAGVGSLKRGRLLADVAVAAALTESGTPFAAEMPLATASEACAAAMQKAIIRAQAWTSRYEGGPSDWFSFALRE